MLILISLFILIALILYIDPKALANEIIKINITTFCIVFIIANISIILRAIKWQVLLKNSKFFEILPIQLLSITISNLTPGKIGEPIKSGLLKMRKGLAISSTLPSVVIERILDLIILIFLSILGLIISFNVFYSKLLIISIVAFIVIILLLLLGLFNKAFGLKILNILKKIKYLKTLDVGFVENFYSANKVEKRRVLLSLLITLLAWILDGLIFYFLASSLSSEITKNIGPIIFCSILSISILASLVTFLPGGIGGTEAIMTYLLISLGFEKSAAGTITLLGRFATLGYSMILGYLSFLYLSRRIDLKITNLLK